MPSFLDLLRLKQGRVEELTRLERNRTALLVIDMQHGFLDAGAALEVPAGREIVPNIERLIAGCRRHGLPVVFTEFVYDPAVPCMRGDPFGPEHLPARPGEPTGFGRPSGNCLIAPVAQQGPDSADVIPPLAPRSDELVIRGHTYDKFLGTPLDLALRSRDIRCLIITGIVTDVCVNCTLMTAANLDYRVTAVTDGVAAFTPVLQQACFEIWQRKFARLRTTAEVLTEIAIVSEG